MAVPVGSWKWWLWVRQPLGGGSGNRMVKFEDYDAVIAERDLSVVLVLDPYVTY